MIDYGTRLIVNRSDFLDTQIKESDIPDADALQEGEVLMEIDKFAYTANNTTYALVGEQIGYWKFFPVREDGFGVIPCWGFANVIISKNNEVATGGRYYGFYPMARHFVASPGKISERGFTDMATHRQGLPVIYNQYVNCDNDPIYKKEAEELQALVRPLFTTSFLIHDQLTLNQFYNSKQIILISASSKTALSLASCLANENVRVIGITSEKNVETVKRTGYYDQIVTYDKLNNIDQESATIVDFAGNHSVQLSLQNHLLESLKKVIMVGMVRYESHTGKQPLPMKPEFFFAPTYAARRIKELGTMEFGQRLARKYSVFIKDISAWINIVHHNGATALNAIHNDMTSGNISAGDGHIVSL